MLFFSYNYVHNCPVFIPVGGVQYYFTSIPSSAVKSTAQAASCAALREPEVPGPTKAANPEHNFLTLTL